MEFAGSHSVRFPYGGPIELTMGDCVTTLREWAYRAGQSSSGSRRSELGLTSPDTVAHGLTRGGSTHPLLVFAPEVSPYLVDVSGADRRAEVQIVDLSLASSRDVHQDRHVKQLDRKSVV